jgi:pyruvate/2-oxoglutarate dehydrogenase complex dihydrolipoamide acyltransferase (E2) component
MARANLRGLIGNLGDTDTDTDTPGPPASAEAPKKPEADSSLTSARDQATRTTSEPVRGATSQPWPAPPARRVTAAAEVVLFSDLQRKEARLRVDQQDDLTEQARRLNRAKGSGGQRITDNTLIRVAVDLLLSKADKLAGCDEDELRRSVGLKGAEL